MQENYELIIWDTGITSCFDLNAHDNLSWEEVYSHRYFDDGCFRAIDELFISSLLHTYQFTWHYAVIRYFYPDGFGDEVVKEFFFKGDGL